MKPFRLVSRAAMLALLATTALLAACSPAPPQVAAHLVEPLNVPWRRSGEQQIIVSDVSLTWLAISMTDRYTVVVYALGPAAAGAPAAPLRPRQVSLRVKEQTALEALAVVPATDWGGVSVGVMRFPPLPMDAAFLQVEVAELRAGQQVIVGPWQLQALVNDHPGQDHLSTRYTFTAPANSYLNVGNVRISYNGPDLYLGDRVAEWQAANAAARAIREAVRPAPFDSPPGTPQPTPTVTPTPPPPTPAPRPYYQDTTPLTPTPAFAAPPAGVAETMTFRLEDLASGQAHFVYLEIAEDGSVRSGLFGSLALVAQPAESTAMPAGSGCRTGPPPLPPGHTFGRDIFVSLEEARAKLPFPLQVPAQPPAGGKLVSVELDAETPSAVALHYDNGIEIVQWYAPEPGDVTRLTLPLPETSRFTDVNGLPAVGHDPGSQYLLMGDCYMHYRGAIAWYSKLAFNHVYGELSLEELRRIAQTLVPYQP